jgi:hypothetical protein
MQKRKVIIGVPKPSWSKGNALFSPDRAYTFTLYYPKWAPTFEVYTFTANNGKNYILPLSQIEEDFILV